MDNKSEKTNMSKRKTNNQVIQMLRNLYELEKRLVECENTSCIMDILFDAGLLNIERSKFLYTNPPKINPVYLKKLKVL